jgi:hypothetical protein
MELSKTDIYLPRPRQNNVFCGPETAVVARGEVNKW